jgi:hypothetical protein
MNVTVPVGSSVGAVLGTIGLYARSFCPSKTVGGGLIEVSIVRSIWSMPWGPSWFRNLMTGKNVEHHIMTGITADLLPVRSVAGVSHAAMDR